MMVLMVMILLLEYNMITFRIDCCVFATFTTAEDTIIIIITAKTILIIRSHDRMWSLWSIRLIGCFWCGCGMEGMKTIHRPF